MERLHPRVPFDDPSLTGSKGDLADGGREPRRPEPPNPPRRTLVPAGRTRPAERPSLRRRSRAGSTAALPLQPTESRGRSTTGVARTSPGALAEPPGRSPAGPDRPGRRNGRPERMRSDFKRGTIRSDATDRRRRERLDVLEPEFDAERPRQASAMKAPTEGCAPYTPHPGLPCGARPRPVEPACSRTRRDREGPRTRPSRRSAPG